MASWSFNPFTGNLDLVGSGGGAVVFEGEVATFADLPVTIGDPAVGAAYLVRDSTGVWLVNRRQAGIYIRRNNAGLSTDWEYGGDYPVNSVNGQSGNVVLGAADVGAAATSHTHAAADVTSGTFDNARINFAAPPAIGNTTPAAGTFTTLTANNGTLTASAPVLDLAQTWNASGVTFTGLRVNVTDTASAAASNLAEFQVGGTALAAIRKDGSFRVLGSGDRTLLAHPNFALSATAGGAWLGVNTTVSINGGVRSVGGTISIGTAQGTDFAILDRDAAHTFAQRSTTNAQTFNIYNTFTSATNHERGFLRWNSNVFEIGTEEGSGGGSRRDLRLKTGIGTHVDIMAGGGTLAWRFNSSGELVPNATNTRDFGNVSTRVRTGFFENLFVGTTFEIYNARTSATNFERLNIRKASNEFIIDAQVGADGGTLRGIKLGSATSSLLGFFGATPVVQQAAVADATDAASTQARLNDLLARLRTLGLIAT